MGVASVISNVLDYGMAPALAVDVARVDAEKCCTIELEQDRVPVEERQELIRRGHRIEDRQQYHPQFSPLVQVTGIGEDGRHFQRIRAGSGEQHFFEAIFSFKKFMTLFCKNAIPGNFAR